MINWEEGRIEIGKKVVDLPAVFRGIFGAKRKQNTEKETLLEVGVVWKLEARSSWSDQKLEGAPPDYLIFRLLPEGKDFHFEIIVSLEDAEVIGSQVILETFSKDSGDIWVNSKNPVLDSLTSTEMEVVIDGDSESIWEKHVEE